ncbi:hypothetical protein FOA52_002388 [Chlamydomonas sp. UWO 241]|nr:hypothetical protein FOA52_002388 [Chlamydomonas sp. UWO 241]
MAVMRCQNVGRTHAAPRSSSCSISGRGIPCNIVPRDDATPCNIVHGRGEAGRRQRGLMAAAAAAGEGSDGVALPPPCAPASTATPVPVSLPLPLPSLPDDLLLRDVRVVLVAPKTEANVGAVARACGNFEAPQLWIVAPRCDPHSEEVLRVACTECIVSRLVVVGRVKMASEVPRPGRKPNWEVWKVGSSWSLRRLKRILAEALADTTGSVGFTRRAGATRYTHASLGDLLASFPDALPRMALFRGDVGGGGTTALVFGREESGLTEEELRLVSHACAIPSGRLQPSLNLSHAASAVLSECFQRRSYVTSPPSPQSESPHSSSGQQPQPQPQLPGSSAAPAQAGDLDAQQQREQQQEQQQQQQQPFWLGAGAAAPPGSALLGGAQTEGRAGVGAAPGDGGGAGAGSGGGGATSGGPPPVEYATAREVEVLLSKLATVAGAAGANVDESRKASEAHARTRLPLGHVRAVLARAKLTLTEVRSLHGLASSVIDALIPGHLQGTRRRGKKSEREKGE